MFFSDRKSFAFTLIELLIVVAIIAILAAIAVPNFLEAQTRAKVARVHSDLRTLATAVSCYTADYNVTPRVNGVGNTYGQNSYSYYVTYIYSGTLSCELPLTTPVAYISNTKYFRDPFSNSYTGTGFQWTGYWMVSMQGMLKNAAYDTYWKANDIWYTGARAEMSKQKIRMNGNDVSYNFLLISRGPDSIMNHSRQSTKTANESVLYTFTFNNTNGWVIDWMYDYASAATYGGATVVYDPTNGTKSNGDIFRIQ